MPSRLEDTMNKVVREHYPVEKLPEDLRGGFPPDARVRVTIVSESAPSAHPLLEAMHASDRPRRRREDIDRVMQLLRED
jgi:hypothetical protein